MGCATFYGRYFYEVIKGLLKNENMYINKGYLDYDADNYYKLFK